MSQKDKNIQLLLDNGYVFPIDDETKSIMSRDDFLKTS